MSSSSDIEEKSGTTSGGNNGVIGGLVRNILRSMQTLNRVVQSVTIGSFPLTRAPGPQSVAKTADSLSQLLEFSLHLNTTSTTSSSSTQNVTQSNGRLSSRVKQWMKRLLPVFPEMVKSTVLGAVLFSSYDYTNSQLKLFLCARITQPVTRDRLTEATTSSSSTTPTTRNPLQPMLSIVSGGMSGCVHGCLSHTWTVGVFKLNNTVRNLLYRSGTAGLNSTVANSSLRGMAASHALIHSCLFGSYEGTKCLLLNIIDATSQTRGTGTSKIAFWVDFVLTASTGALAGVGAEIVGFYTEPIERLGVRGGLAVLSSSKAPNPRLMLSAAVPSGLGFLAYEFSKREVSMPIEVS